MGGKTGKFLGIPYDWRPLTGERLKSRWWNPDDPRLFTPKALGWGFDVNFARLLGRKGKDSPPGS
ncbi:DUF5808 domain-containing protein [Kribbella sp. NPDC059898]|uniref:DUF5808 domain-containing protein n=1 Tax=Kribbella sp. NPDC059898 TaxID=3346995 RepID=UPI00364B1E95